MDNSDLRRKIAVRHAALKELGRRPIMVLEMFAGEGEITKLLWSAAADRVVSIERNAEKASKIAGADIIVGDNAEHLNLAESACIIDCDAYGGVMGLVRRLPSRKLVVFTDGTLFAQRKAFSMYQRFARDLRELFSSFHVEESGGGTAYYGYGWTR